MLMRTNSDHHSILVDTVPMRRCGERPFWFEAALLLHEEFKEFLGTNWNKEVGAHVALGELQQHLKVWNKEVFEKIEYRIKMLNQRLVGEQCRLEKYGSPYLIKLEQDLQNDLNEVLLQEVLWYQKSRGQWIVQGDRNTKYYHTKTLIHRRRNKVKMLRSDEGGWVTDEKEMEKLI